ncbi:site-2 protease family protein [Congregicoccus parvus]|uniref:site-2 protease family protein n=1 Tax=Congregicoccus parvus TaxID=3081749 RepID=UPI003FA5E1EB
MSWSFKILRVAGIDVRIHVTFLLFLLWIGWSHYTFGGVEQAYSGVGLMLALFGCVLLHEFGHAFAARRYGIHTPDITMLPIGGLARLERMPEKPGQELVVALAGPAVNVVIAGVAILIFDCRFDLRALTALDQPEVSFGDKIASVNVMLVLFNLLPAFPMDGGRVLRALLAMATSHATATQIAARVGQALALVFGFLGLFGNPMLLFIALFVFLGASQENTMAQMKDLSGNLRVSDAMVTQLVTLDERATLDDAVEALLRTAQHEFPVVDTSGRVLGILTRDGMIAALKRHGAHTPVAAVMHRNLPVIDEHAPFKLAFEMMHTCGCPAIPVLDRWGRLAGLITPENIGELMMLRGLKRSDELAVWRARRAMPPPLPRV